MASPFIPCDCGHKLVPSSDCVHRVILTVIEHELLGESHPHQHSEDWMICHLHWLIGISLSDRLMLKAGLVLIIIFSLREGGVFSSISVGLRKFVTCSGHESLPDVCTRNKFSKPITPYWISSWLYWFFSLLICFIVS